MGTRAKVASIARVSLFRYCASLAAALFGSINSVDLSVLDNSRYHFKADPVEEREEHSCPHDTTLISTIVMSLVLVFAGGFLASKLRLPPLLATACWYSHGAIHAGLRRR